MMPAFVQMLEPWFLKTLEISLHASFIIGVLLLLRPLLKRMLPARWVYALWFVAIIRMVLIEVPSFSPPANPSLQMPLAFAQNINGENALTHLPLVAGAVIAPGAPAIDWMEVASVIWLIGAVGFLVYIGTSHFRWSRRLAQAPAIEHPVVVELLAECCAEMDVRQVRLVQLPGFASPFITRLFHPTIVLPEDFLERFSREELRWILLHELAHLKRLDLPVQALCQVLQAIYWFNPLVWLGFACFRTDRELACDAYVLDRQSVPNFHDYGHALIKVAETYPRALLSPGFLGVSEERTDLQERVEKISRHRRPARMWIAAGAVLCALLAFVFLTREAAPLHSATAKIQINVSDRGVPAEVEIIQSESIVVPAIVVLGLDKTWAKRSGSNESALTPAEIMDRVSKQLVVKATAPASNIVYVTVNAKEPKEAADIANAVVEQYRMTINAKYHQSLADEARNSSSGDVKRWEGMIQACKQNLLRSNQDPAHPMSADQIAFNQGQITQLQALIDQTNKDTEQKIKSSLADHETNDVRVLAEAY